MKDVRYHSSFLLFIWNWSSQSTTSFSLVPLPTTLELDELWSFVLKKANRSWVWIALCRKTRQVVAYTIGDRSKETCLRLWEAIPSAYREGHCFTDFWAAYAAVIPEAQHSAVGKETGETAHVERWNKTLRQRLARFVRMTLSFSKSVVMLRPRVFSSFSIAPIESGPSCSSEPLPGTNEPTTGSQISPIDPDERAPLVPLLPRRCDPPA